MKKIIIAIVLFLAACSPVAQPEILATPSGNVYVSPAGNDTNIGTQSAPFLTIKKAISASNSGDTIIVSAGKYSTFAFSDRVIECIPARTCIVNKTITLNGNAARATLFANSLLFIDAFLLGGVLRHSNTHG